MKKIALVLFVLLALVFISRADAAQRITLIDSDGVELGTATNPLPVTGAGGSPGGSDQQVQFNNGGSFGGDAGFTYDLTDNDVVIGGDLSVRDNLTINDTAFVNSWQGVAAGDDITINPDDDLIITATNIDLDTDGNMTLEGSMFTDINVLSKSGSYTVLGQEAFGTVLYCDSAATITLPAIPTGGSISVVTIGAVAISVDPNANDYIILDGTVLDNGDKITNTSTTGDIAVLTYFSADGWYATTDSWTDGG